MKKSVIDHQRVVNRASGFTLVEMLIAVALVLLMMSMFAQIFVMATDSLSQQRGIAENDQRGRMLSTTLRSDLDGRTFRDVLPFRANENTTLTSRPLSRRAGYFEIDEGDPSDDTDDVLQLTVSINLPDRNPNGSRFTGMSNNLTTQFSYAVPNAASITITGDFTALVAQNSFIWISGSAGLNAGVPYSNDGRYLVNGAPTVAAGVTTIPLLANLTVPGSAPNGQVCLSEFDPEFDDGLPGNGLAASSSAEVSYFLRNGTLYRRVLLIRDTQSGADAQPKWSSGTPIGNTTPYSSTTTTFWHDFDYSAFYQLYLNTPSIVFHDATDSLNNGYVADPTILTSSLSPTVSLGLPYQRFGHSVTNGLPQDASTVAKLNGVPVYIGRFNLQECANTSTPFGYPGNIPASGNPFDRQDLLVDSSTGLVTQYEGQTDRRGLDILLANVLSFDVKVWDPINSAFVDLGSSSYPGGPFSPAPAGGASTSVSINGTSPLQYINVGGGSSSGVLYNYNPSGTAIDPVGNAVTIVGGRLNSMYGSDASTVPDGRNHYRFDTWHPNASITTTNLPASLLPATFYNQPPYFNVVATLPYTYNEPPFVPAAQLTTGQNQAFPLAAIRITINYRDVSSNQIRQMTMVQSLIDRVQSRKPFAASAGGSVSVPTID